MSRYIEIFEKVQVNYDHSTQTLYIKDYDEGETLAEFKVVDDE